MASDVDLSGTWRAAPADAADGRDFHDPAFDDTAWAPATVPGHWRSNPALADTRRSGAAPHRIRRPGPVRPRIRRFCIRRGRVRPTVVARARRHLLHERRLARRHLPGRHRGLLLPPQLRGHRGPGRGGRAHPRPRGGLSPARRPDRQAQPHRRVPALGPARPGLEPRRDLAARAPRAVGARCASATPVVRCRDVNDERAIVTLRAVLDTVEARIGRPRDHHHPEGRARRGRGGASQPAPGRGREPGRVDRRRARPRSSGGPTPSATSRSTTCTSRCGPTAGSLSDERRLAARPALGRAPRLDRHGQRRAPVPQGHEPAARPAWRWPRPSPPTSPGDIDAGARRRPRPPAGARPHQSARALRRRPTRPACCSGRTCRCSGATAARSARRPAARPGKRSTCSAHHPSLFVWCGHNEPMAVDVEPATLADRRGGRRRLVVRMAAAQALPSWNRSCSTGPSRRCSSATTAPARWWPTRACSPTCPSSTAPTPTSTSAGTTARSATCPGCWPAGRAWPASSASSARQAVPDDDDFVEPERWPDLDWDRLTEHHALQKPMFDRHVPPSEFATFDDWKEATQRVPGPGRALPRRDPAAAQVPAHRRLRPVLPRRRLPGGRPRSVLDHERHAQAGLRRPRATPASP